MYDYLFIVLLSGNFHFQKQLRLAFPKIGHKFAVHISFQLVSIKICGYNGHQLIGVSFGNKVDDWRMYHPVNHDFLWLLTKVINYQHGFLEQAVVLVVLLLELVADGT